MRTLLFVLILLGGMAVYGHCQVYKLNAHTFLAHAPWKDSLYRFGKFQDGSMIFNQSHSSSLVRPLNYNLYLKRIEMITEQSDTIPIEYSPEIKGIRIASHVFVNDYPNGYAEILLEGSVSLGAKYHFKVMMESGTGERFVGLDMGPAMTSRFVRLFLRETTYYFIDKEQNVRPANKSWILKLFPKKKREIQNYLTKYDINFRSENDLVGLLNFCTGRIEED